MRVRGTVQVCLLESDTSGRLYCVPEFLLSICDWECYAFHKTIVPVCAAGRSS